MARIVAIALTFGLLTAGCELRSRPALITVYSPALSVSFPLPQGWQPETPVEQAGFHMQTFAGASADVPERVGIRVQVMGGPAPDAPLEQMATRYRKELKVAAEGKYSLYGFEGKTWSFVSEDGEESSRLMLIEVDGTLYGIYVRGEARTLEAYEDALNHLFRDFEIEKAQYFEVYEGPGGDVKIRHPHSWERTQTVAKAGESLFLAFLSPPLAVERDGTTIHATLEVTVNQVPPETTVESFYAERAEQLGDNYRLLAHESLEDVSAISTLYHIETQLAEYLERTVYVVRDGKSYIFKFNARNQVYRAIEQWIDEMVRGFFLDEKGS